MKVEVSRVSGTTMTHSSGSSSDHGSAAQFTRGLAIYSAACRIPRRDAINPQYQSIRWITPASCVGE